MDYLENLLNGNIAAFRKQIEGKLAEKVFDKLATRKQQIANSLFVEAAEETVTDKVRRIATAAFMPASDQFEKYHHTKTPHGEFWIGRSPNSSKGEMPNERGYSLFIKRNADEKGIELPKLHKTVKSAKKTLDYALGEYKKNPKLLESFNGLFEGENQEKSRLKLVMTHSDGNKTAKVYKDLDWNEYRVKTYTDGVHHSKNDYHTDNLEDAHTSAKSWLKHNSEKYPKK